MKKLGGCLAVAAGMMLAACASGTEDAATGASDVTAITPSAAVQQAIPNCWDFATAGWVEALSRRPEGGVSVDVSEAYVSYLWWLAQLVSPGFRQLHATGSWGNAVEAMRRWGWMNEIEFLSQTTASGYAARHSQAWSAIEHEISSGDLKTQAQRQDRKNVIAVLNRAWQLAPEIAGQLARTFGDGLDRDLRDPTTRVDGTAIHRLADVVVGYSSAGATVTAADLVGEPAPGSNAWEGDRAGPFAYSTTFPPDDDGDLRTYFRRAQKALNQDIPVPMALLEDDVLDDASGTFRKPASGALTEDAYAHLVLVFDESVQTTDFGLLAAGTPETRPAALASSLRDDAQVLSLRALNSYWGTYDPGATIAFAGATGVNDYALDYLAMATGSRRVLGALTLPNDETVVLAKKKP